MNKIYAFLANLGLRFTSIQVKNVKDSIVSVNVIKKLVLMARPRFVLSDTWFEDHLSETYDLELRSKYTSELHQITEFERVKLKYLLDFVGWKSDRENELRICGVYIEKFRSDYHNLYQILNSESIAIIDTTHPFIEAIGELYSQLDNIEKSVIVNRNRFLSPGFGILDEKSDFKDIPYRHNHAIPYSIENLDFLDKEPADKYIFRRIDHDLSLLQGQIQYCNLMLKQYRHSSNNTIISGIAGAGKSHILAHMIQSLTNNSEYVLFFKPKYFNGDDINFEDRLLQILHVPTGYTLKEILKELNTYANSKDKRCFIFIDALNETTKSSIGFSNIWRNSLQTFINHIGHYSHIHFVCSLRTSYINNIWDHSPQNIIELNEINNIVDLGELCIKYFSYYKIEVTNIETADLSYFRVPLLLDLFCKLSNESRSVTKKICLDIKTYRQVFEEYIDELISEVQKVLSLQRKTRIIRGFAQSSELFLANNEAVIEIDDFSNAFDDAETITIDQSIANRILSGSLVFIKEYLTKNTEIVKHTQQEVGGYLLAKRLAELYPDTIELANSTIFIEKIIGQEVELHHQLRLDILKFLIALRPDLILYLKDENSIDLSLWYIYNGYDGSDHRIIDYLTHRDNTNLESLLKVSAASWLSQGEFNFDFVSKILGREDSWTLDMHWTSFVHAHAYNIRELLNESIDEIERLNDSNTARYLIIAKFASFVTSTTIRDLRDISTIYLLKFGIKYPIELLNLTISSATLSDVYIYERLAAACYGVALNCQNDEEYVLNSLPIIAQKLYDIQFNQQTVNSVFNYIVTDSVKHIIDLALLKGVFHLSETDRERVRKYKFILPETWSTPSDEQIDLIQKSNRMDWPDPIGMDFGIYTIPRLVDGNNDERVAIANVYNRIFELGFHDLQSDQLTNLELRDFYYGSNRFSLRGKIDRLGKKYSWKAFFDYAGYLLYNEQLQGYGELTSQSGYQRLSDVDIDICMPKLDYQYDLKLYKEDLLRNRLTDREWYKQIRIDSITPFFLANIQDENCIMLHGFVEQRVNEEYKTRSFLLTESFFIKKNNSFEELKAAVSNKIFDWDFNIHIERDHLTKVYFGELYWADTIPHSDFNRVLLPTGEQVKVKRKLTFQDVLHNKQYSREDIGMVVEDLKQRYLQFDSEPTLLDYLWETSSNIIEGYHEYYPSIKMAKALGIRVNPRNAQVLDMDLKECYKCVKHEEGYFQNTFNYIRSDLLQKYMTENDLALVYQVKQHSYDENFDHNRSMKFFIMDSATFLLNDYIKKQA